MVGWFARSVGASVALSDVDIVWVQNPFEYLYRDADVEGMTDGWDDVTAYGWEWASATTNFPEPVAVQRNQRLSARNSGLFFLQATEVGPPPNSGLCLCTLRRNLASELD